MAAFAACPGAWGSVPLGGGVHMPRVGLGTFRLKGAACEAAVGAALRAGVRHVDTATCYRNAQAVGRAMRASGVPREDVFVTTKVSPYEMGLAEAREALERELGLLGLDYVDLALVHWPGVARKPPGAAVHASARADTWRALERARDDGLARAIGVSNYTPAHLAELLRGGAYRPQCVQVEAHPRLPQRELRSYCEAEGIAFVAYSPLGCGELVSDPAVRAVASREGVTPAQALLLWSLASYAAVIPKSADPRRVEENAALPCPSPLSAASAAELGALAGQGECKYAWDPADVL